MLTKDFVKLLLVERKKLLRKKHTIPIKPPHFDELSVDKIYDYVVAQPGMAAYFPDTYPKGRKYERSLDLPILNTNFLYRAMRQGVYVDSLEYLA